MSKLLKEICTDDLPSDFITEVEKSAFHAMAKTNNSLLNISTVVELDDIVDLQVHSEKLSAAEKIFKNIDTSSLKPDVNNNNNETIIL